MSKKSVFDLLLSEAAKRDNKKEIHDQKPDPLLVAAPYRDEYIALICAMYSYGNAMMIVKFLKTLDFSLLDHDAQAIQTTITHHYYRFQTTQDTQEIFLTLQKLKQSTSLESIFMQGYKQKHDVMDGIFMLIDALYSTNPYRSRGYEFLIGKIPKKTPSAPYKRWHMFLRWMVRKDALDLGLWSHVDTKDLLIPLDTHTFNVGKKLGLIQRKTYDFKAVLELTNALKALDPRDPVRFDFALYRLGQENLL
ncbi:TIGR02757 family protein [Sulfurospirillum sp. 1612]|uniref:TIGR02757 family protein n=1 Tax=Sulfurospirillum sp. 1612 TaxID=3094835 RepID=UPI002F9523AB